MRAVLDQELARFGQHGIDASMVLVTLDDTTEAAITAGPWPTARGTSSSEAGFARRTLSCSSSNKS